MAIKNPNPVSISSTISPDLQRRATTELLSDLDIPLTSAFTMAWVIFTSTGPFRRRRESSSGCSGFTKYIHSSMPTTTSLFTHSFSVLQGNSGTHTSLSLATVFFSVLRAILEVHLPITQGPYRGTKSYVLRKSSQVYKFSHTFWLCLINDPQNTIPGILL